MSLFHSPRWRCPGGKRLPKGRYRPPRPPIAQRSPKSTSSIYDPKVSSSPPISSKSWRRKSAAVMGAKRIRRAWFQEGPSGFPDPQRQAQAPREISSKAPSTSKDLPPAESFPWRTRASFSPAQVISRASPAPASRRCSGSRSIPQSAASIPRFTAAANPRLRSSADTWRPPWLPIRRSRRRSRYPPQ